MANTVSLWAGTGWLCHHVFPNFVSPGRQADGQAFLVGLVPEGCPLPPGKEGWAQCQIPCLSRVSQEKTPGQNHGLRDRGRLEWGEAERIERKQRDRITEKFMMDYEAVHYSAKNLNSSVRVLVPNLSSLEGLWCTQIDSVFKFNNIKLATLEGYL